MSATNVPQGLRLGVLTIGQAPRMDLTPEILPLLTGVELVESGILDGLTYDEVLLEEPLPGDHLLTTRMKDGRSVVIGESFVMARLPSVLADLEARTDAVLLACTGPFPTLSHSKPLVVPDRVICHCVAGLADDDTVVGVIAPLPAQEKDTQDKFTRRLQQQQVITASASPYTSSRQELVAAAEELRVQGVGIIALDCIGYTEEHRRIVAHTAQVPVVLARSASARFAMEALSSI
jgi:protein AroM